MKMMKKLMAVALAGVMALTLLAGCGNPYALTEKELLNALTDLSPVTLENGTENGAKATLKAADNADAAKVMQALALVGQDPEDRNFDLLHAANWQTVLNIQDGECVRIAYKKVTEIKSETLNKLQNLMYASDLLDSVKPVTNKMPKDGAEATVSVKIGKIGDAEYIVMVLRTSDTMITIIH